MKITLIQDFLRSGGTERQTVLLANAFAAAGHSVTLVTFRPGGTLAATVGPNIARRTLQPFDLHLDWFAPGLVPVVSTNVPDIVLCMGRMANCYAGALQRALPKTAVIATMRTGKKLPRLYQHSLVAARAVVANSRDARDNLVLHYGVPADKITVIHNSLVFAPLATDAAAGKRTSREQLRAQHSAGPLTTILLCVAMFRPEKNQRELIEIAAGLPASLDWQLWFAGDGPARAACEQLAAKKGLTSRVRFLGFHRDPTPLYQAADIAVHASWSEALSNFLIEAQAHGLPAVAYEAQGIEECFVPNRTGWVIPRHDHAAFRRALSSLLVQPAASRHELAAAAADYARITFDRDLNVQRYLDLFARLY